MSMPETSAARPPRPAAQPVPPSRPMPRPEQRGASQTDRLFYPQPLPRPWWMLAAPIMKACFDVAVAPLRVVVMLAELVMAAVVLGVAGAIGAWWMGWVSDEQVLALAKPVGDRLMAIVQSLGYL